MKKYILPLMMIGLLFAVFGFAAWLNSILIPYFQITLELDRVQTTWVTFSFFIAYVVMALPSSWLLKKTGFKNGLVIGLLFMAGGALCFVPAAHARTYWMFLTGLFVMGTGQALLQTAANPYITLLGPNESAAKRNSFMGICNKLAGIAAQRLMGPLLLFNADSMLHKMQSMGDAEKTAELNAMALRVVNPYSMMTVVLVLLALMMALVKLPQVNVEQDNTEDENKMNGDPKSNIWQYPNLVLGVLALFCAEGLESITSYYIIPYGQSQGFSTAASQIFVDYIIYAMLAGYLCGVLLIPKYIKQQKALMACALLGICFCVGALSFSGFAAVLCFILMGFCNALNWPCIWPLAIKGLGKFTQTAAALLIMSIAGDAIFPVLYAWLNEKIGNEGGTVLLIVLYLIILTYSVAGYKKKAWTLKLEHLPNKHYV